MVQILIPEPENQRLVAGIPCALRSAHRAAEELSPGRIIFCADQAFEKRWHSQIKGLGNIQVLSANGQPASTALRPDEPLLVLSPEGFPGPSALKNFVEAGLSSGERIRWTADVETVALFCPKAGELISGQETAAQVARKALSSHEGARKSLPGWIPAADQASALAAEENLCDGLLKDTDGYLARYDRKLSIALSRLLLKTPVTPNQITTASLILGLFGAWGLASGSYAWQLAGALVLWACCILDGSDGEVARLKLLCSPSGAAYDLAADHLAHLATFAAIPLGVHRANPQTLFLLPGILIVTGFLASVFSVWWLVLRLPEEKRGPYSLLIERIASRDYVYLIVALAALGRLEWFLWAAGVGSHLFCLALWAIKARRPSA